MLIRFGLSVMGLVAVAACNTTPGGQPVAAEVAQRIDIASSAPNAYGTLPCTMWGMAAEQSMLGYQLGMRPFEVLPDMPRELATAENVETLKLVMSNVANFDQATNDADRIYVGERYRDLVVEECTAVRAS